MPGGVISPKQRQFLEQLLADTNLILSTKKSDQCSVNIHGHFYLSHKTWNDGMTPNEEDLLGLKGNDTETGEPISHFHITWADLHWVRIESQPNKRIKTAYRVRFCREKSNATEEIYFYAYQGPSMQKLKQNTEPDLQGWVSFQ